MTTSDFRTATKKLSKRPSETADDYPHVVAGPTGNSRIVRCPDDLQFILQRGSIRGGEQTWNGIWFFHTLDGARFAPHLREKAMALFEPDRAVVEPDRAVFEDRVEMLEKA